MEPVSPGHPGDDVHDAADGVGAVEHRGRTPDDLHLLHRAHVHQGGQLTEVPLPAGVVDPEPVRKEEDALAPLAPNGGPRLVRTHAGDVQTRDVAEQVADAVWGEERKLRLVHHRNRTWGLGDLARAAGGGHQKGIDLEDDAVTGLVSGSLHARGRNGSEEEGEPRGGSGDVRAHGLSVLRCVNVRVA